MSGSEINPKTIWAIAFIAIAFNICAAQTSIDVPDNSYSIQEDIRIGRKAAVEIEKQLPLVSGRGLAYNHIEHVGRRLVRGIPAPYWRRAFVYRFDVVNVRDINAFALHGPMRHDSAQLQTRATNPPDHGSRTFYAADDSS